MFPPVTILVRLSAPRREETFVERAPHGYNPIGERRLLAVSSPPAGKLATDCY